MKLSILLFLYPSSLVPQALVTILEVDACEFMYFGFWNDILPDFYVRYEFIEIFH